MHISLYKVLIDSPRLKSISLAMSIPLPPKTQALKPDSGWKVPPLDGSLNMPQMLRFNYSHNANKPLFVYVDSDNSLQYVTWRSAVGASYGVASILSNIEVPLRSVVAIFSSMNTMTYWSYMHGIMAAGHQPFPIQVRNHAAAVSRLLKISNTKAIVIDAEGPLHTTAMSAIEEFNKTSSSPISVLTAQSFEQVMSDASTAPVIDEAKMAADLDSTAMIMHSAGRFVALTISSLILGW
jgi:long-subunit acyl-CoA synthetase (AMP-forming)